jgi:hypothetical protein
MNMHYVVMSSTAYSVGIATRLQAAVFGVRVSAEARDYLPQSVLIGFALQATYSIGTGVLSWGQNSRVVMLTTELHLSQRLRMSGAIPLLSLSLCAFTVRTVTTLSVT